MSLHVLLLLTTVTVVVAQSFNSQELFSCISCQRCVPFSFETYCFFFFFHFCTQSASSKSFLSLVLSCNFLPLLPFLPSIIRDVPKILKSGKIPITFDVELMENKYFCFLLIYFFVKREKGHSKLVKHFYFTCMFDLFYMQFCF